MLFQWLTQSIHVYSLQVGKKWEDFMVESEKKWLGRPRRKGDLREVRHGIAKLIMGPHTTNTWEEHSYLQRGSNPSSHQSGGCRATPYVFRSVPGIITNFTVSKHFLRIFYSLYLFLESCFCDCAFMLCFIVFYTQKTPYCVYQHISYTYLSHYHLFCRNVLESFPFLHYHDCVVTLAVSL
jgi:hypothetical protein